EDIQPTLGTRENNLILSFKSGNAAKFSGPATTRNLIFPAVIALSKSLKFVLAPAFLRDSVKPFVLGFLSPLKSKPSKDSKLASLFFQKKMFFEPISFVK